MSGKLVTAPAGEEGRRQVETAVQLQLGKDLQQGGRFGEPIDHCIQGGCMEDYHELLRFWSLLLIYLTLLGVFLVILGIALAGLVSALRARERQAVEKQNLMPP